MSADKQVGKNRLPPTEVELIYQRVGDSHVFTAPSIGGFYYSSTSLDRTFNEAASALGLHISRLYSAAAEYRLSLTLKVFKQHLEVRSPAEDDVSNLLLKNSVIAKMASTAQHV